MAVLPSQARHAPEASATTTTTTTTADHRGRCRAALPCCLFARGPPIVVVVVVVGPSHEKVPWMSDMAREPKGSEERGGSRQTAGRQTGHRHRARAARTRWPAPLTPCHCMQPCQGSVVEVAVDVGRGPVALGDLAPFSCTFLGGRQVRWVESSRWGEFDADRRGVEVPGIRRGRVVWCPGPCRRDLVHGHGCLMLGSERKGVVAPRVSTILPVPESLESRVERRASRGVEWSLEPTGTTTRTIEIVVVYTQVPTYGPRDHTQGGVIVFAVGPWESARFQSRAEIGKRVCNEKKKDLARQRQRRGCSVPIFPAANWPPSFWTGNTCEHGPDHVASSPIPGRIVGRVLKRVKKKY